MALHRGGPESTAYGDLRKTDANKGGEMRNRFSLT